MDLRNVAAAVHMGQVLKSVAPAPVAGGECVGDGAFIEIDGAGVEISRGPIGRRSQREVVRPLLSAASAEEVAAVCDSRAVDLHPGCAAVQGLPNTLIGIASVHVPDVHLACAGRAGAVRNGGNFAAIDRAGVYLRSLRRAGGNGEAIARLRSQAAPIHSIN